MDYDIAIIGLGPAGATLARLLPKGMKALALDKKAEKYQDDGFRKPCGGLLAPDAQKEMARLGLTLPLGILTDPQIFSVRTIDIETKLIRNYRRFYLNLDRHAFDIWLKSLIPREVEVHSSSRLCGIREEGEGYRIAFREEGRDYSATARIIAGADGAVSRVRRFICPEANIREYLSIQQVFRSEDLSPFYCSIFDSSVTDCYAWGLSKKEKFYLGGAFNVKTARRDFERLKEKLSDKDFPFPLGTPLETQACKVLRPLGMQHYLGRGNVFLLGEAAGLISPSSLEGISYAIGSARLLARALSAPDPRLEYRRLTAGMRAKLLVKNLKTPFMYRPILRRTIMASGLGSIKVMKG